MAASRLVTVAAAALAVALGIWNARTSSSASSATSLAVTPTVTSAEQPVAGDAPQPAGTPASSTPHAEGPAAPMPDLTRLLTAPEADLRASLQAALSARQQGGRLYARALARRCAMAAELLTVDTPDTNDVRHQRAVARHAALTAGCGQFAAAEWAALVNIAPADDTANGDPLLAVQQSDLDDAALLQAVFTRPDALLIEELGERLLLRRIGEQPTLYFDGTRFDDEAGRSTAQAALRLLPCEFGLACDERDPEVWLACLRGEGCAASRADQASPAALALATRLAAALRARDLGRFMPS